MSPAVTQTHPTALDEFKSAYSLEFLSMQEGHSEADLHGALLRNLGRFITELGRDFCFVGSQYPVQVGNQDFAIDRSAERSGGDDGRAFALNLPGFLPLTRPAQGDSQMKKNGLSQGSSFQPFSG